MSGDLIENAVFTLHDLSNCMKGELKNYKNGKSWKIFAEGQFFYMAALMLANRNVITRAKVHHSMAVNQPPLKPSTVFNPEGTVKARVYKEIFSLYTRGYSNKLDGISWAKIG